MASRFTIPALAVLTAFALFWPASAMAGKSGSVANTFKGQILISENELPDPDPEDTKGTIKLYRAQSLKVITGSVTDGVASWSFHFTAFMKSKPKTSSLTLEFYTDDKEKLFVADKRLNGADPSLQILASTVNISEDENLNRGRKYVVKLVATTGKKTVILASTKIATK